MAATLAGDEDLARAMPAVRAAFEAFKEMVREGRMQAASRTLFGAALDWGQALKDIYHSEGRAGLVARDALTRFFILRFRGMPTPADLAGAPPEAVFLMAYTAFHYLDVMLEETVVGEHAGTDGDGTLLVHHVTAGEPGGLMGVAQPPGRGWCFDLMPLYRAKAEAMDLFIAAQYGGDFEAFFDAYLADLDVDFDRERAWLPLPR